MQVVKRSLIPTVTQHINSVGNLLRTTENSFCTLTDVSRPRIVVLTWALAHGYYGDSRSELIPDPSLLEFRSLRIVPLLSRKSTRENLDGMSIER